MSVCGLVGFCTDTVPSVDGDRAVINGRRAASLATYDRISKNWNKDSTHKRTTFAFSSKANQRKKNRRSQRRFGKNTEKYLNNSRAEKRDEVFASEFSSVFNVGKGEELEQMI